MFDMDIVKLIVMNKIMYRLDLSMTVGTYKNSDNNNNNFSKIYQKIAAKVGQLLFDLKAQNMQS